MKIQKQNSAVVVEIPFIAIYLTYFTTSDTMYIKHSSIKSDEKHMHRLNIVSNLNAKDKF